MLRNYSVMMSWLLITMSMSWAAESLWVEGKDVPSRRVNVGLKALSPHIYVNVAEALKDSIVNISTSKVIKRGPSPFGLFNFERDGRNDSQPRERSPFSPFFGDEFFERFFGGPGQAPQQDSRQRSLGSGFVLHADGFVVTNNHVVDQADEIRVVFADESELVATVVGRDAKTDVALLKIDAKRKLQPVILGDSTAMKVGEIVIAIGNPFGLSHTTTQGIISAKERSIGFGNYDDFIQTDASINPGNSGGPLLNLQGEVIGINTAIVASGQGIGFAIPINLAKHILSKLKQDGRVIRGWLGVSIQKVTEELAKGLSLKQRMGALVAEVNSDSPAQKAGLRPGDVIVSFDGKPITDSHQLPIAVANTSAGKRVTVEVIRGDKTEKLTVVIAELKDDESPAVTKVDDRIDRLGLRVEELTPEKITALGLTKSQKGVLVTDIAPESQSYRKGMRQGDVIVEINRTKINSVSDYLKVVKKLKDDDVVLALVQRRNGTIYMAFALK